MNGSHDRGAPQGAPAPGAPVTVEFGDWERMQALAMPVRFTVFVQEQQVPAEEELDHWDARCVHALARAPDGRVLGTGRLLPDGHIGRMAVLREARGRGVGSALLTALVGEARRRGHRTVVLSAQTHACPFYARHGFVARGHEYLDAGIPHLEMWRDV